MERNVRLRCHEWRVWHGGRRSVRGPCFARCHRGKIFRDLLESLPARPAAAAFAGLHQVTERHQISAFPAVGLVARPRLRRVVLLDRQGAIRRRCRSTAVEEAARPRLRTDSLKIRQRHAVVGRDLLDGELWHQLIDVDEATAFHLARKRRGSTAMLRFDFSLCHARCAVRSSRPAI